MSQDVFDAVQAALRRNSGRSETLHPRPEREYLLKGLIRCAHCLMPLWAQTLKSGSRLYREQHSSRSHMVCPADGRSIRCHTPDEQMGKIVSAIVLPEAWMDRLLAQVHLADEVNRIEQERKETEHRLHRLGKAYVDGLYSEDDYRREKHFLEDRLASLVVPGVDAAREAGRLLEDLPSLWDRADLSERRKLLLTMLDAVYVDTIEEKSIVAITPKPAFVPFFEMATTRKGSDVLLLTMRDPAGCSLHETEIQHKGHYHDAQHDHVGDKEERVSKVGSIGRPQNDPRKELNEGRRAHVPDRAGAPHLDHLGHEPQGGEHRRYPADEQPDHLVPTPCHNRSPRDHVPEAQISPCLWWRRGRVELPVQKAPR